MTPSKASVEERPLQDKPCSTPPTARVEGYSLGLPCKATACNCAQRPQGKEKLRSKLNTDLEVITAFKNEDEDDDEEEDGDDGDDANWLG